MSFHYESGQPMPKNVVELILYLSKVGAITSEAWVSKFSTGGERWTRGLLRHLHERGVLQEHSCNLLKDVWVLGSWSKKVLNEQKRNFVTPVPPQMIEHDETVGLGMLDLMKTGRCQLWFSERELKMMRPKDFVLNLGKIGVKYPDAVLAFQQNGNVWLVAIEYERTGKDKRRYEGIFKAYSELQGIHQILFIVGDEGTKQRISMASKGYVEQRVGFVDASEWKRSSNSARIQKQKHWTSFNEILKIESLQVVPQAIP